jgi:Flp pilus assembly protein TadD
MNDAFREQLNEAEMAFKLVLSVDSEDPGALNGLGSVYILRGNLDLAESYVRRALEILPDYEAAKQDLALIERLKARR